MTDFLRTADEHFHQVIDFDYTPHYHNWQDLRMHYVDEGPRDGPVMLLMHGMPTWSYLYRDIIPLLVDAGYRCIAPDHMGFGRSDKPTDIHWYTIARHTEILSTLIRKLDLKDVTLVCQDWGGPTGLAQSVYTPDRFSRLIIMNTWLHHEDYTYSGAIENWNQNWHEGGRFHVERPNVALLVVLSAGLAGPDVVFPCLADGSQPDFVGPALEMYKGFSAPYQGLADSAFNGYRRFPLSIPLDSYSNGNAAAQSHHYETLLNWPKPAHFIWGCDDDIFTEAWGRTWAKRMKASFTPIEGAGHFLQNTHGNEVARIILEKIAEENSAGQ